MKRVRAKLKLVATEAKPAPLTATPQIRGYIPVYRPGELNRCPGCGRSNWIVRSNAECGFCGTALPIVSDGRVAEDAW